MKSACHYDKVGHAGTLDPMATGLLIIGYNEGTKLLGDLMLQDKQYQTTIKFGIRTETGDKTGAIIEKQRIKLNEKQVKQAIASFVDQDYLQRPHPYSAVKVEGKKAYEYARAGIPLQLEPRLVRINGFKINDFNPNKQELKITLNVTKGFYVRSFAEDLAAKLHTVAHITSLIRTKCGDYKLKNAYTLIDYINSYGYKN
ncbi:MAG: tRNA pseudouridine(55) synthase TruB [Mycoplasmoidaceae bacterium]|nr:tRNA pseudouridine(55) synthase TruB [Mycoplasmoidaceae bacterium]